MNRRLLLCLAALGMSIHLAACTSGDKKDDVESASSDVQDLNDPSAAKDDALLSDSLPEDSLGGKAADSTMAPGDMAASPSEPPMVLPEATPSDSAMMGAMDTPAPPAATDLPTTSTDSLGSSATSTSSMAASETPKVVAPLQKVATKPWKVGKDWFNGVYFARPGDTLKSISTTIYGENRTALLKKGNPSYKDRAPKPGDKVYYASVKRPGEQEQMLNYYEETGVAPEVYVAKDGDNLRKVSKQLLGYDNAWKETWASNASLESKSSLTAGTEVRYWASAATASAPAATGPTNAEVAATPTQQNTPPPMEQPQAPPQAQAMNDMPPPPPPQDMPPPPPPQEAMSDLPPPPPPSQAMNDIPPPPPIEQSAPPPAAAASAKVKAGDEKGGMDEDTMMALGTVAVAAAGIAALLVIRRRRKQNALDAGISESTHVG